MRGRKVETWNTISWKITFEHITSSKTSFEHIRLTLSWKKDRYKYCTQTNAYLNGSK
jgi:hypothetical protein